MTETENLYFSHEVEQGMNPEVNPGLWTRLLGGEGE